MVKKHHAKKRKLNALKITLKEEIELNFWTLKKIESLVTNIHKAKAGSTLEHIISASGTERIELLCPDGYGKGQFFPKVINDLHTKLIIEIAESDKVMYKNFIVSFKSLSELQHLRNGIVDLIYDSNITGASTDLYASVHNTCNL